MKILITYASAGAGHKKAAEAILEVLRLKGAQGSNQILLADSLDYTNAFFRWMYSRKYITLVKYLPHIWGFFYYLLDNKFIYRLIFLPRRIINAVNCWRFENFLLKQKPDIVISAHFMANEIVTHLKQAGKLTCRLFCAVTDYRLHSFWVASGVDLYFAALEDTKADLINRGVPADKIITSGVPIGPKFALSMDKPKIRVGLGLNPYLFTVLIVSGGFGVGPVELLVRNLGVISQDIQLIVVCGYNKKLFQKVNAVVGGLDIKGKVYGFVENMYELMSASDVMVTKSGGLTASEALAKGLAAIFIKPIPGQEEKNAKVLEKAGAAFVAGSIWAAKNKVRELFYEPKKLASMVKSASNIAKPSAAIDLISKVII